MDEYIKYQRILQVPRDKGNVKSRYRLQRRCCLKKYLAAVRALADIDDTQVGEQ